MSRVVPKQRSQYRDVGHSMTTIDAMYTLAYRLLANALPDLVEVEAGCILMCILMCSQLQKAALMSIFTSATNSCVIRHGCLYSISVFAAGILTCWCSLGWHSEAEQQSKYSLVEYLAGPPNIGPDNLNTHWMHFALTQLTSLDSIHLITMHVYNTVAECLA